jgi:microcystin-dependent protein
VSTGYIVPTPRQRYFDSNGAPLASGKLYSYAAGTTTPLATYTDQALTTPSANPVILDANGEATIYIPDGTNYKFVLKTSADVQQWSVDNIQTPTVAAAVAAQAVPSGGIIMGGWAAAPTGYLLCDGSAVSRATYATLFTAISTAFGGGDGSTTFNVPDLRQKFPLGKATAGTGVTLGSSGGTIDHVHTGPSHTHDVAVPYAGWGTNANTPPLAAILQAGGTGAGSEATCSQATGNQTVTSVAGGTGNTGTANPPWCSVQYAIKT